MKNPLISVIIPVYNVEKYLDRCMNSIVNQTYKNLEIILVDDGSPDNCPQMCDAWACKDSRVKPVHKENGGLSSARNCGIEQAMGVYLTFVDSDDWLESDAIEYLYYLINRYEADFSMGENVRTSRKCRTKEDNIIEKKLSQGEFLQMFFKVKTQINVQYAWAKLYKKELFGTVKYQVGMIDEDVPATFEIALKSSKIAYGTKIVYDYYINESSITNTQFSEKNFDLLKAWDLVCSKTQQYECPENIKKLALLNRKRADLGIPCNLAMDSHYEDNRKLYSDKVEVILEDLKKSLKDLIKADIPVSRKIIAAGFCVSYPFSAKIINIWSRHKDDGNLR